MECCYFLLFVTFDDGFSTANSSIVQKASIEIEHELGESGHGFDKFLKKMVYGKSPSKNPPPKHLQGRRGFGRG